MNDDPAMVAAQRERLRLQRIGAEIIDRAQLIARMVRSDNAAARAQAVAAIERGCRAESQLAEVRAVPSPSDLVTNAVALAMYETAREEAR